MLDEVKKRVAAYLKLREVDLPNSVPPALYFDPEPLPRTRRADAEIAAGQYRGPLHGIP